jgi:basic membrane protein A
MGWNHAAKEAADAIAREFHVTPKVIDRVGASEHKTVLRNLARDDTRLIFCHGYEFNAAVRQLAGEFKGTHFVISGYDQPGESFLSLEYDLSEAAYVCGVIAAVASETGCVGFIAAQKTPPVALCYDGFRRGFLEARPTGIVREPVYIEGPNPWEDAATAKIKTQALLRSAEPAAVDVLFQNTDTAGVGVFEAVAESSRRVFVFGANRDQNDNPSTKHVLASAVIHVDRAFLDVAREVAEGKRESGYRRLDVNSGFIGCVLNPRLDKLVGAQTAERARMAAADALARVRAGSTVSTTSPSDTE